MSFRYPEHALEAIERRGLGRATVDGVLDAPAQSVEERFGRRAYRSRVNSAGGEYPVRALIDPAGDPLVVLTASRTSRIAKNRRTG